MCEAIGVYGTEAFLALPLENFVKELSLANDRLGILAQFPSLEQWSEWRREVGLYQEALILGEQQELRQKEQEWAQENQCQEAKSLNVELYPKALTAYASSLNDLPEVRPLSLEKEEKEEARGELREEKSREKKVFSSAPDRAETYIFESLDPEQIESLSLHDQELHHSFKKASFFYEEEKKKKDWSNYISKRGIRHLMPVRSFLGAFFVLLLTLNLFVCAGLVVFFFYGGHEAGKMLIESLCILAFSLLGYIIFSMRARCSICRNPFFLTKGCPKNHQSHRLPFLGIVIPTALHILLFRWLRCPYCGSAQKLTASEKEH